MKKILFIFNPRSGKGQIKNKLLDILDVFTKAGYQVLVHVTQRQSDAMEVAASQGKGADMIVCSGGDGTLNEVISGMMKLHRIPLLGYIPAGSTNDFASSLKLPKNMVDAARNVVEGMPLPIDIGAFCEERNFVYIAAFGAFTEVSYLTPQDKKNVLGHQAYMIEGVKSLTSIKSYRMQVESDEAVLEGEFIFGMITNTRSVGGFKGLVSKEVELDDGVFEALFITTPRTPMDFSNIINYLFLKEEPNEYVHRFRTARIRIRSAESVDWVLDGEFGGSHTEVDIVNLPRRIQIMGASTKK